jgi:ethanolamine ammonia-lyase large subunit
MTAAVGKLMRIEDLIAAAAKIWVVTLFRTTVGLAGGPDIIRGHNFAPRKFR